MSKSLVLDVELQPIEASPLYQADRALSLQITWRVITSDGFSAARPDAEICRALVWRETDRFGEKCSCASVLGLSDGARLAWREAIMDPRVQFSISAFSVSLLF